VARRWSAQEEDTYRKELYQLYVIENKTISEAGEILGIAGSSVYQRLIRLNIPRIPSQKKNYLHQRRDIEIPTQSAVLAEFLGIMLGDGHVSPFQTIVTLGTKELEYVEYVADLMFTLFGVRGTVCIKKNGYRDVYIGSVVLTKWLREQGLVSNKVAAQADVPAWIFEDLEYMRRFIRGFFDTDGSIYALKFGRQISLTNFSAPLLVSLQMILTKLGYKPSAVSSHNVYLTRKQDIERFFEEICPANTKHLRRYEFITNNLTRR
jgi:DNA-binding transcriptional regulator WhiA